MKHTTNFIVGNTAIQIVEKGKHIKVIDVEEHREKKSLFQKVLLVTVLSVLLFSCCYSIISKSSQSILLSRQIATLNTEIEQLEKEKSDLQNRQIDAIDYDMVMQEAVNKLGMAFPENDQVYTYRAVK